MDPGFGGTKSLSNRSLADGSKQRSYHYPQANRDVIENKFRRVNTGAHPKHNTVVDPNSSKPGEPPSNRTVMEDPEDVGEENKFDSSKANQQQIESGLGKRRNRASK